MINLILNVLWFLTGGVISALLWFAGGVLLLVSIVGIPWARSAFNMASFVLWPFGRDARTRGTGGAAARKDLGTGLFGLLGNVVWIVLVGVWLFIAHVSAAVALALTIIGIPFAYQHVKIALFALAPVGKSVQSIR